MKVPWYPKCKREAGKTSSGKHPPTRLGEMLVIGVDVSKNGFNTRRRDRGGGGVTRRGEEEEVRQDFGEHEGVRRKETN